MLAEAEEVNKPEGAGAGVQEEPSEIAPPVPKRKAKTKIGNKKKRKKTRTTNKFHDSEAGYEVSFNNYVLYF